MTLFNQVVPADEHPVPASAKAAEHGAEEGFRSLVVNIPGAVYRRECVEPWTMHFVSDHIEMLTGYPASEFTDENVRSFESIICPDDREHVNGVVREALGRGGSFSLEYRIMHANGSSRWVAEHGRGVADSTGRPVWIDGVILDLSVQRENELLRERTDVQWRHRSGHDSLTCLPDRTLIRDRLQQMLLRCQREHFLIAALLVDLDNFRSVNDTLGQQAGDELLKAVAARFTGVLRASDTVGRPGGDEFAILAEGLSLAAGPELLAERLIDAMKEPFRVEGFIDTPISITASIGIATNDGDEPDDLLRDAAIALCQAKAQGRNCHVRFRPEMKTAAMERLELEADLREALQENQFFLLYQPIFELDSVAVCGVEALLRWRHPVRGIVDPASFMPVLEETGLIAPVGSWLLRQACRRAAAWHRLGHHLTMTINVSARQLETGDLVDLVRSALSATALEPRSLIINVAEQTLKTDMETMLERLRELKTLGVLVAVDDLGAGYSALARLREVPVDALKIDRSFVAAMADSKQAISSIHTLVQLGRTLGFETLAEGIEQGWQLAGLQDEHCKFGQGSLFSQPIAPEALEAILTLEPVVPLRGHLPRQSRPASTIRRRNC
ncbi:MAG: putative bifunctional diguanylate cyclase/phosphodiesterase [Acidimicrobiales bacterium]|jgi:diguanylate cyclase (GGDEF)-like protein/PAS domain S-box-containing protein